MIYALGTPTLFREAWSIYLNIEITLVRWARTSFSLASLNSEIWSFFSSASLTSLTSSKLFLELILFFAEMKASGFAVLSRCTYLADWTLLSVAVSAACLRCLVAASLVTRSCSLAWSSLDFFSCSFFYLVSIRTLSAFYFVFWRKFSN